MWLNAIGERQKGREARLCACALCSTGRRRHVHPMEWHPPAGSARLLPESGRRQGGPFALPVNDLRVAQRLLGTVSCLLASLPQRLISPTAITNQPPLSWSAAAGQVPRHAFCCRMLQVVNCLLCVAAFPCSSLAPTMFAASRVCTHPSNPPTRALGTPPGAAIL